MPSGENQTAYFTQFRDSISGGYIWSGRPAADNYYFQFFDTPYKSGDVEKSFGIFQSNNRMKPEIRTVWAWNGGKVVVEPPTPGQELPVESPEEHTPKLTETAAKERCNYH